MNSILFGVTLSFALLEMVFSSSSIQVGFGVWTTIAQVGLDLWIARTLMRSKEMPFARLMAWSWIITSVGDGVYGIFLNVLGIEDSRGSWVEVSYNVPFVSFLVLQAFAWVFAVGAARRRAGYWGSVAAILGSVGALYFLNSSNLVPSSWAFAIVSILAQSIIIPSCALFLFFGLGQRVQWVSAGTLLIVSVNLLLQYLEVFGNLKMALPFEAVWIFGQICVLQGLRQPGGVIVEFVSSSVSDAVLPRMDCRHARNVRGGNPSMAAHV